MVRIDPHTLYTRSDLIGLLSPLGIDADSFIARIRPKKVFRTAWYGRDLIRALDEAPALSEPQKKVPVKADAPPRYPRRRTSGNAVSALERLAKGGS